MSYEVGIVMSGPDLVSARKDFNEGAKPLAEAAGAIHVAGWQVISGALVGQYGMNVRWDSLDAADAFFESTSSQAGPGGDTEQLMSRYQLSIRGLFKDVLEAGTCTGKYMMVSRFRFDATPVGLDYAIQVPVTAGANGGRIVSGLSIGEWSGQLFGYTFYDSLDTLAAALEQVGADERFRANAIASGAVLQSRAIFRAL